MERYLAMNLSSEKNKTKLKKFLVFFARSAVSDCSLIK